MKVSKQTLFAIGMLILVAALYRLIPNRPAGFAPQMALALFGGAMIKDKRLAFALPIFSLFASDVLFQALYVFKITSVRGFYPGQTNVYLCFILITMFGFLLKKINFKNVALFSISGSLIFFITSNFLVWLGGGGLERPKTFAGLMQCYTDAYVFYRDAGAIQGFQANLILGDLFFTAVLFGGYYVVKNLFMKPAVAMQG